MYLVRCAFPLVMAVTAFMLPGCATAQSEPVEATIPMVPDDMTPEERVEWVRHVQEADFFFWERYAYRLTRDNEFDLDEWWYQPNVIVDGAQSHPLPRLAPEQRTIDPAAFEAARDYAFAHNTSTLHVIRNGAVEYEHWKEGHAPGKIEKVHSFSKTLVALLTGIAISDGKISSVDDPIGAYITEWADDPRGTITIRDLLQGSSGMEKVRFGQQPDNKMLHLAEGKDVTAAALDFDLAEESGKAFVYNSLDTQLGGLVVERATGIPYAEYLSSKLWAPLGNGPATLNVDGLRQARTFCCARSQSEDWLRIGQLILQKGAWDGKQIIPAEWIAEMVKPSAPNPYFGLQMSLGRSDDEPVGEDRAGFFVHPQRTSYDAEDVAFLTGANYVNLWIVPSRGLVILRLGEYHPDYDTPEIVNAILTGIDE